MLLFLIEGLLIVLSIVWGYKSVFEYKLISSNGLPANGFFPFLAAMLVLVLCVFDIIRTIKRKEFYKVDKNEESDLLYFLPVWFRPFFVALYLLVNVAIFRYVGVITATFTTCFFWLVFISKEKVLRSAIISVVLSSVVYLVFVFWLRVSFPRGILF